MNEIKIWIIKDFQASPVQQMNQMDFEKRLEEIMVKNPELLMPGLTLVGRQTQTEGGSLDLLGVDSDGKLVVFELKRGTLSRGAVAQIIDYASYLEDMDLDALANHISDRSGVHGINKINDFENWYIENLGFDSLDSLRPLRMFLVGLGVDDTTERMVNFLAQKGLDISLLTFYGFEPGEKVLLARQMRVEGQEKAINPLKNDNVTLFAKEVADLVLDGLPDDIKPKSRSQFAHDYGYGYRSYSLWYSPRQERSRYSEIEINLYYEIGIHPSKDNQFCTNTFVAITYNIHDAALINTLEQLDIQENQWHERKNDTEGRIRVDYGENELNDDFAKTLAKTLRRFIKVATPKVDAFVNERNEEDA